MSRGAFTFLARIVRSCVFMRPNPFWMHTAFKAFSADCWDASSAQSRSLSPKAFPACFKSLSALFSHFFVSSSKTNAHISRYFRVYKCFFDGKMDFRQEELYMPLKLQFFVLRVCQVVMECYVRPFKLPAKIGCVLRPYFQLFLRKYCMVDIYGLPPPYNELYPVLSCAESRFYQLFAPVYPYEKIAFFVYREFL